jgi:serine/threonine protein kinase
MTASATQLHLLGEIASGGMGSVHLARLHDGSAEYLVAIKRMHPEYAKDPDFVRMFKDEIFLTGSIQHPAVVSLIGWGEDNEGPYLLMEYIEGVALALATENGREDGDIIPPEVVVWVAARVAEGLHAAHSMVDEDGTPLEIVHRDITPSNVMIGFDGSVKITDFGIAKATVRSTHTRTGTIKGKIAYMSPEYAARRIADGRSDLYSLGIVMFESLTGEVPFKAEGDLELLKLVAYAATPSLASVAPDADPELIRIVDRLLSKDPDARFENGRELARELDTFCKSRGWGAEQARSTLAAYVKRNGSGRREALRLLSDDQTEVTRSLDTATFTFFETETTRRRPFSVRPNAAAAPPKSTRKLSASEAPPPPPSLPSIPKIPTPGAVPSFRSTQESVPVSLDRPAVVPSPIRSQRLLLIVACAFGLVGIAVSIALAIPNRKPAEASIDALQMPPPPETVTATPAATPNPEVTAPKPAESPVATDPRPATAAKKPPRAGTKRRPPGTVSGPKQSSPCTPDRFDYPACLKR